MLHPSVATNRRLFTLKNLIQSELSEHLRLAAGMSELIPDIEAACRLAVSTLNKGHKIFFAGNGGSAADSQHLAAELVGRFRSERKALPGIALTTDSSILTAVANDYGYDHIFTRQLAALALPGDIFIAISTSGSSANLLRALEYAKEAGLVTIGLLGRDGGQMKRLCDAAIVIPSHDTARIQEMHILTGHIICSYLEAST